MRRLDRGQRRRRQTFRAARPRSLSTSRARLFDEKNQFEGTPGQPPMQSECWDLNDAPTAPAREFSREFNCASILQKGGGCYRFRSDMLRRELRGLGHRGSRHCHGDRQRFRD